MSNRNKELIASLSYSGDELPKDALSEAIRHYEDIKPELHAALRLSPDEIIALETGSDNDYMLQFFAMYLAAEKRDNDAFPLIRDFFAKYGDAADEISGDMVCEHLDRILASVCQDPDALKSAAELPGLSLWPRCAFYGALGILYHQGYLERAQLVAWFQAYLQQPDIDIDTYTSIGFTCCDLALHELEGTLLEGLKNGRMDPESMYAEDLKGDLRNKQIKDYKQVRYELVDNAIDLLHTWYRDDVQNIDTDLYEPEELMVITAMLDAYNRDLDGDPVTLEFFHGYVHAVVLTPETISAGEWLPEFFGGEMPAFDSIEKANAKLAVLMHFYNRLNQLRLEQKLHCPFRLEDRHRGLWLNHVREWCRGFVLGINLRRDYWSLPDSEPGSGEINAAIMALLAISDEKVVIEMFGTQSNGDISKEGREFLARAILTLPDAIRVLTEHTQEQDGIRVANLPARSEKVGRNAPCPCGSGKKFKRCCGAPGRSVH